MSSKTEEPKELNIAQMGRRAAFLRRRIAKDKAELATLKEQVTADFNRPV